MAKEADKSGKAIVHKMDGKSLSPQKELAELLKAQFPLVFSEGKVNPDKLRTALGEELDTDNERYGLLWAGKTDCFRHIQETTTATLKPVKSESIDFDKTQNIFIEGDNSSLVARKDLKETSHEKRETSNEIVCLAERITKKFVDKVLAEKPERFTCLDVAFKNNDQLKTNTTLQMESAKIEFKVI